ncbi:hypothetical protein [Chitinilyticum piscinae]|uniref:Uncharacterized protein n=1 Tax=Chitinilyticum piscinae TaxID=2866724 RepID=A0A8J7FI34_9NEIS|nr:hypothetical protein [Chitinilyticum piscinae]MBE9607752.1 hypothetical protein [Chitinilyticum piscinae]
MKLSAQDWQELRPALIWSGIAVAIALALLVGAWLYQLRDVQFARALQLRADAAETDARLAEQRWDTLTLRMVPYSRLQQEGVLGQEPRLAWIEALDLLQARQPGLALSYDLGARQALAGAGEAHASVRVSRLQLSYRASDELQYSRVTAQLQSQPGRLLPRHCTLLRLLPPQTGISVECEYDWATMVSPQAQEGGG